MSTESSPSPFITPTDLQALSTERFGSPLPGLNAAGIIAYEKQRFSGVFYSGSDPRQLAWEPKATSPCSVQLDEVTLPHWDGVLASQACAAEALAAVPPFAVTCTVDETWRTAELIAGAVTPQTLARYLQKHELEKHTLRHGALPRAVEVLLAAAGLTSSARPDYQFKVARKSSLTMRSDIERHFDVQLGCTLAHRLAEKVDRALLHQVQTGAPLPSGEVIIEGPVSFDAANGEVRYEALCRRSLTAVLSLYTQGVHKTKEAVLAYAAT